MQSQVISFARFSFAPSSPSAKAGARRLALYHHEPANDDQALARILEETRRLEELTREGEPLEIVAAYDGLEIEL